MHRPLQWPSIAASKPLGAETYWEWRYSHAHEQNDRRFWKYYLPLRSVKIWIGVGEKVIHRGQEVNRYCTRGESEDSVAHGPWSTQARRYAFVLNPRADVTTSPRHGYQWSHEKDLYPSNIFKIVTCRNLGSTTGAGGSQILGTNRMNWPLIASHKKSTLRWD